MNCSVDIFTILCNAVQLAKDEQIRLVTVLRSRLAAHHPGQESLIDAAIALWANYACCGATTSAQGVHHDVDCSGGKSKVFLRLNNEERVGTSSRRCDEQHLDRCTSLQTVQK